MVTKVSAKLAGNILTSGGLNTGWIKMIAALVAAAALPRSLLRICRCWKTKKDLPPALLPSKKYARCKNGKGKKEGKCE
jgi:hypothetical protein